eukprot:6022302-Heterocapsa_arctica.AAC.1
MRLPSQHSRVLHLLLRTRDPSHHSHTGQRHTGVSFGISPIPTTTRFAARDCNCRRRSRRSYPTALIPTPEHSCSPGSAHRSS